MAIDVTGASFGYINPVGQRPSSSGASEVTPAREREARDQRNPLRSSEQERQAQQTIDYGALQRRVEAKTEAKEVSLQRQREINELPAKSQRALSAYSETASLSSRNPDNGELVGIDIFV